MHYHEWTAKYVIYTEVWFFLTRMKLPPTIQLCVPISQMQWNLQLF